MMDLEKKAEWCKALRSGEYKQGFEVLCIDRETFCCLGVLAVLQGNPVREYHGKMLLHCATDWMSGGLLPNKEAVAELVHMNDIEKKSFSEIADWIEANL